jgi:hypothetical protein
MRSIIGGAAVSVGATTRADNNLIELQSRIAIRFLGLIVLRSSDPFSLGDLE